MGHDLCGIHRGGEDQRTAFNNLSRCPSQKDRQNLSRCPIQNDRQILSRCPSQKGHHRLSRRTSQKDRKNLSRCPSHKDRKPRYTSHRCSRSGQSSRTQ